MAQNVIVVFGGVSNENEISVITGAMAANVLTEGGKRVYPVYIDREGNMYAGDRLTKLDTFRQNNYKKCRRAVIADGGLYLLNARGKVRERYNADCVLNCCHGGWGEGGGLSGLCAGAGLPFAGAGIFESAAFMDKYLTKLILSGLGVNVAPYTYIRMNDDWRLGNFEFPLIVKPVSLGSSIGVSKVEDMEGLEEALNCAFTYDSAAIVEKYIPERREINCAAYYADDGIVVSECEEAVTDGDILSFEDKYQGGAKSVYPAEIPAEISTYIRETTRTVFKKLNMRGIVRFDYIYSDEVYLSEVNTVPGSLAYYLFSKNFKGFFNILDKLLVQAEKDFLRSHKKILTTGILANLPSNACKIFGK